MCGRSSTCHGGAPHQAIVAIKGGGEDGLARGADINGAAAAATKAAPGRGWLSMRHCMALTHSSQMPSAVHDEPPSKKKALCPYTAPLRAGCRATPSFAHPPTPSLTLSPTLPRPSPAIVGEPRHHVAIVGGGHREHVVKLEGGGVERRGVHVLAVVAGRHHKELALAARLLDLGL